jgi:hypothetical protein
VDLIKTYQVQLPTPMSSVVLSTTAFAVLLLTVTVATQTSAQTTAPELCRCTAKFEHFYNRRNLLSIQQQEDRTLLFENYAYDYTGYYIDDNGYYVVEGVRVLPNDDPACSGGDDDYLRTDSANDAVAYDEATSPPNQRTGILAKVFGTGRSLFDVYSGEENEESSNQDEFEPEQRTLMGMMGGMMSSSDEYYGKGKVRLYLCIRNCIIQFIHSIYKF